MSTSLTSPSEENYLEWIYRFSQKGPVRPKDLAANLGIKPPSVTKAVSSLVRKGLVRREPRGALVLTAQGESLGKAVVRRDKCLTTLLVEILDMGPELADQEIHRLEHVLSEDVLIRLETLVDFARQSPAWLKRLHLRINQSPSTDASKGKMLVGQMPTHSGFPHKQRAVSVEPK
jgi:Mn-dependent DtxR family transcriptional regulator